MDPARTSIRPLSRREHGRALRGLLASGQVLEWTRPQADTLWLAEVDGQARAAAWVFGHPGDVGILVTAPDEPDAPDQTVAAMLRQAADEALAGGAVYVQATAEGPGGQHRLRQAGFSPLATLVEMHLQLPGQVDEQPGDWRFIDAAELGDGPLGQLLLDTYEDTRDCPSLLGLRSAEQVLAAHRATVGMRMGAIQQS